MTAAAILSELLACGINPVLTPDGAGIEVPAGCLSDVQRASIRTHKPQLVALLAQQSNDSPGQVAPAAAPDPGTAWRAMRDAYYSHHASCPTCRAAGLGYGLRCGAGAALWAEYGRDLPPPLRPRKGARG